MSQIVLFGVGRGADVAHRFLTNDSPHEIVGFTADAPYMTASTFKGLPVCAFEDVERVYPPETVRMLILLGYQDMNGLRARKFAAAKAKGYTLESYICSDIFRVEPIRTGENCFILDNQSISLDVEIGNNVVMWSSNHIGDLAVVEDNAWISSHVTLAASARVGRGAFLGVGATVANAVNVGAGSFVGAHTLVTADTQAASVHLFPDQRVDVPSRQFMRILTAQGKL
jgi:acetyltransferase-like isoleucine patch superfamily enzyme